MFVLRQSPGAHEVTAGISTSYAWFVVARDVVAAAGLRVKIAGGDSPAPVCLYGGAALLALCYAAVAAAGAATYRALWSGASPSSPK